MEVKLLLAYNIKTNQEAEYYRYVVGEFLPILQNMGLPMIEGWHTAYGNYPIRLIIFGVDDKAKLTQIMQTAEWKLAKEKLLKLVSDYEEQVVLAQKQFQFFVPAKNK